MIHEVPEKIRAAQIAGLRAVVLAALCRTNGNRDKAAESIGCSRRSIYRAIANDPECKAEVARGDRDGWAAVSPSVKLDGYSLDVRLGSAKARP